MSKEEIEIAELRHKEIVSGIVGLLIMLCFTIIGFVLMTQERVSYEWRGQTLWQIISHPFANMGLFLIILGFLLGLPCIILAQYYSYKRKQLLKKLGIKTHWWD